MGQPGSDKQRLCINEFLFALYYFAFFFIRPLAMAIPSLSTLLLIGSTGLIAFVYLCVNLRGFNRVYFGRMVMIFAFVLTLFLIDLCFRYNSYLFTYAYEFLIYGLIPLFLLIQVTNYEKLLYYWSIMAVLAGLLFSLDPLNDYAWTGNYMIYGINVAIPAFAGSIVLSTYFRKRWNYVLAAVFLVEVVLFANRTTIITALAILMAGFVYFHKGKTNKRWLILSTVVLITVFLFRNQIVEQALNIAESLNIDSYALTKLQQMLNKSGSSVMGSRMQIWENAWEMIWRHPILGNGVGMFETENPGCVHNVFLDIWTFSGIVGLLLFVFILVWSIVLMFRSQDPAKRVFDMTMLILWIVTMQFSLTLWAVIPFWTYFGSVYMKQGDRKALAWK